MILQRFNLRHRRLGFTVPWAGWKWPLWPLAFLLLIAMIGLPAIRHDAYLFRILTTILIWSILALGQNVITGFCGQLSFGQAAFYGIGAYTSALLSIHFDLPYPLILVVAAGLAGIAGVIVGYPAIRIGGDYLFLVTIGFAEIIREVFLNWDDLTGGAIGLPGVPPVTLFGMTLETNVHYYYLSLACLTLSVIALMRILDSDVGRCFKAVREDELAARAAGINVTFYKLLAFGIGAALGGVAGSLIAHFLAYVGPDMFTNWESTIVFAIVLVGGLGSVPGTILGAVLIIGTFESIRQLIDYRLYIAGLLLVGTVLIKPSGLLGAVKLTMPIIPPGAEEPPADEEPRNIL